MKNTNETQTLSKVDTETSDIFFNYGAVRFSKWTAGPSSTARTLLLMDAKDFLDIVHRPYLPEQLVQDFLDRS